MTIAYRTIPLLIAALGFCLTAHAQSTSAPSETKASAGSTQQAVGGASRDLEKEFKEVDRDGDGFVSRAEVEQNSKLKAKFEGADKNGDGKLDLSEFQVLEAEASPDRSLGSVSPVEKGAASGASK
jgi:hypothetical protein